MPAEMFAIAAELSADKNDNAPLAAEIRREAGRIAEPT